MLRQRSPQNRNDRKGMKNRGRGLCKKANDYHQLFGEDILVLLKAPNDRFEIGFQSKPGLLEFFCNTSVPENVLRGPETFGDTASSRSAHTEFSSLSNTDCSIIGTTPSSSDSGSSLRDSRSPDSTQPSQPNRLATTLSRPLADASPGKTSKSRLSSTLPRTIATKHSQAKLSALIEACFA